MALGVLQVLHIKFPDLRGTVIISCDNDESLRRGIEYQQWPTVQSPHFDLLSLLYHMRRDIPFKLVPHKIKGHQDSAAYHDLTRLEVLNVIADDAARTMAHKIELARATQANLAAPSNCWRIYLDNRLMKKRIRQSIRDHVMGERLFQHWIEKGRFSAESIRKVDWEAIRHAVKRKPLHHQRWATKFISGFCGSYYKLHQMNKHPTPLCPRCNLFDETTAHILFCQDDQSENSRR